MALGLSKPTGKSVRDIHSKLTKDWDECIHKDEKSRDIVYNRNKVEILTESSELRLIKPYEYHCLDVETPILTRDLRWYS